MAQGSLRNFPRLLMSYVPAQNLQDVGIFQFAPYSVPPNMCIGNFHPVHSGVH